LGTRGYTLRAPPPVVRPLRFPQKCAVGCGGSNNDQGEMMKTSTILAIGITVSLGSVMLPASAGPQFQDGLWEIASTMELGGMPMPGRPYVQTRCYTPSDAADDAKIVPAVNERECAMTDHKRSGSKLSWNVRCSGTNTGSGTGEIVLNGQSYEGSLTLKTQDARLGPVEMVYRIKAHRTGDCKH
jgi:hypothetical protein